MGEQSTGTCDDSMVGLKDGHSEDQGSSWRMHSVGDLFLDASPSRLDARARAEEHARAGAALRRRRRLPIPITHGLADGERQVELLERFHVLSVRRECIDTQERASSGAGTGCQRIVIRVESGAL